MIKKILTVSAMACAAFLAGCGEDVLNPVDKDEVDINLTAMSDITGSTTSTTTAAIIATIDANVAITAVDVTVKKADGSAATDISVSKGALPASKEKITVKNTGDMPISLIIEKTATNGTYIYTLTATAGAATSSKSDTIVLSGMTSVVTNPVVSKDVILGAHDNAKLGSSLDLDNGTVMLAADARAAGSAADIVYTYSTTLPGPVLMNPYYAKNSSKIDAFTDWVNPFDTKFHKVTTAGVTYESITTDVALKELFNEALATEKRLPVAVGDLVVVKTSEGNYALIKIGTVSSDETGSASIKYAK